MLYSEKVVTYDTKEEARRHLPSPMYKIVPWKRFVRNPPQVIHRTCRIGTWVKCFRIVHRYDGDP